MELRDYITPLRKWWWLIVASTLVATVSSLFAVNQQPSIYQTRTTLLIGQGISNPNPTGSDFYLGQQLAQSYSEVAKREPVQDATMAALGLNWLPEYTARTLSNGQLIELAVTDTSPERAMIVARELAHQLVLLSPANASQQEDIERQTFIDSQLDALEEQIEATNTEIETKQAELGNLFSARQIADTQAQVTALQSKLNTLQSNYASLLASSKEGALNTLNVLEPATLPTVPVGPDKPMTILTAAAIGFVLAAGAAYLLEYLDRSIKSPDEVVRLLDVPLIGFIGEMSSDKNIDEGAIVTRQPRAPVAESFRALRTNLEFAGVDVPMNTILISSPGAGEGKTTVAVNLAAVIAQSDKRVILVDCDLRRPRVHKQLAMSNNRGISDVFIGNTSLKEVIRPWKNNFAVITSGALPPNPAELLGSEKMSEILTTLQEHADIVLLDAPPFLVTDPTLLAAKTDGAVMVIQPGKTLADPAVAMREQLDRAGARIVGAVLNRIPISRGYGYYYGGYRNYNYTPYHYGGEEEQDGFEKDSSNGRFKLFKSIIRPLRPAKAKIGKE